MKYRQHRFSTLLSYKSEVNSLVSVVR